MYRLLLALSVALATAGIHAQTPPYAGQQDRQIKSLSEKDVADLLAGQGSGLAKAAELNGYPGPAHVLEHADALALSAEQRRATKVLMHGHKARARSLGAELVGAERALDEAFARKAVNEASLATLTAEIGKKQAQLRAEHLRTHLEQTALLTPGQVQKYAELRGYTSGTGSGATPPEQQHRKHH